MPGADGVRQQGRQQRACAEGRGVARPGGVEDPKHAEKLHAREPGDPVAARSREAAGRKENAMSGKTFMNGSGESYSGIVPTKQPNEAAQAVEEAVEGRPLTKENTQRPNPCRTQSRESGTSGLGRVREAARKDRKRKFTALLHHVTIELLRDSYQSLKKKAAAGVDGVTWEEYGKRMEGRLADLHSRIHRGAYRAQPSRRVWIPKADGRQRPLGIAALEDKIVQRAVGEVLNQIWEVDFKGFSYGFRPGRSQHDALDALWVGIMRKKVNWILDLDIRSFFDRIQHEWLVKFVEQRVGDQRVVRLIQKWLKAGVVEKGEWSQNEEGSPQGSVISPILANLYLHYVLDVWAEHWRNKQAKGDVVIVRYADDAVLGFQHRAEAEQFLEQLKERLGKFGMELHPEKTRLIEFGRMAAQRRSKRGEGEPETFNFLGFTHICGTNYTTGNFAVHRRTIGKRMAAKLKQISEQLRKRMHEKVTGTLEWLQQVVRGFFQYHAVPGNTERLNAFRRDVARLWYLALRRRSQRSRLNRSRFEERLASLLPPVQVLHPYPGVRFDVKHPNIRGRNRVR
ncbi:MAG: group II intron reverse transcriptase/maturase [Bryobacteraceae bacterium]